MYGRRQSGRSFLKENIFLIDSEQFFAYKRMENGMAMTGIVFLKAYL